MIFFIVLSWHIILIHPW